MSRSHALDAIRVCRPELARDLEHILALEPPECDAPHVEVLPSRRGALSLRADGRWVHSSVDPVREAARLTPAPDAAGADGPDSLVVEGLGLGYLLEALSESEISAAPRPWIAVTHHPHLLNAILAERDPDWWCTHGPDRLVPGWLPGTLVPVLQALQVRQPEYLQTRGECQLVPEQSAAIGERFTRFRERMRVNRNTLARFGPLWVRNTLAGVERYGLLPGMDGLEDRAGGLAAVVLAAGPTLDELLPHLAQISERAVVVAVDTAVVPAQRAGVQPDLAVISDPQYWNTRHLDRLAPGSALLIAEPATHPRTLRLWPGPMRMSASLFPLGEFFDRHAGRKRRLGAGGSVATSAWDLARILGSRDIALAGADLGFPGYRTHCADSFFERRLVARGHRRRPAETGLYRYLHGADTRMVDKAGGGQIPSDARMQIYRSWFAEQAQQYPDVRTRLLSGDSSRIDELDWCSPEQWLAEHPVEPRLAEFRAGLTAIGRHATDGASPDAARTTLLAALDRLEASARRGRNLCMDLVAARETLSDTRILQQMRELDGVDREIASLAEREIAGFLAGDVLSAIAELDDGTVAGALNGALALYETLLEAVAFHRGLIARYRR